MKQADHGRTTRKNARSVLSPLRQAGAGVGKLPRHQPVRLLEAWTVSYNPKPIPDRRHDYDFVHDDYDGTNGLCGSAASVADALEQIETWFD